MKNIILTAALFAAAVCGQEYEAPKPGPICGDRTTTPATDRVEVSCIDFNELAKRGVPGVSGQRTQVLLHAKFGDSVRVEVFYLDAEGKEASLLRWADLRRDAYGNLAALVQFPGFSRYTRYTIHVKRAAE